jgi:phytoene dehydrogenase-like protein
LVIRGVDGWQPGFTIDHALAEPPRYSIVYLRIPGVAAGMTASTDKPLVLIGEVRCGRTRQDTPVSLTVRSSMVDLSHVPEGKRALKILASFPYKLADDGPGRWNEFKEDIARTDLEYQRTFAPNRADAATLGSHAESPVRLGRRNAHNGHVGRHGGDLSPAQSRALRPVPGRASHRVTIGGPFQVGAATHPGASVAGGTGRTGAMVILDDRGLTLDEAMAAGKGVTHA